MAQDTTPTAGDASPVGLAEPSANAFEFVGVIQQLGMHFTFTKCVINVRPQMRIGTVVVESADSFTLANQTLVFGEPGLRYRLSLTGQGALHYPETLEATILVVGNGVVAG